VLGEKNTKPTRDNTKYTIEQRANFDFAGFVKENEGTLKPVAVNFYYSHATPKTEQSAAAPLLCLLSGGYIVGPAVIWLGECEPSMIILLMLLLYSEDNNSYCLGPLSRRPLQQKVSVASFS